MSPYLKPSRDFGSRWGALVIDSMPPATTISTSPARISWSAIAIALRPERHTLLMVIDGMVIGMPAATAGRAGGVLAGTGLDDLAHDHVVDLVAGDAGLLERALDGDAAEVGRGLVLEATEQASDGGARSGDDDGTGHACLQRCRTVEICDRRYP